MKHEKNSKTGLTRISTISKMFNTPRVQKAKLFNIVFNISPPNLGFEHVLNTIQC